MTDVKRKEQDACPWPRLGSWLRHAVQPITVNKPRCHRAPDGLLQNADDNSLSYWGGSKDKVIAIWKALRFCGKRGRGRT